MPKYARRLDALLTQREQWEQESRKLFKATREAAGMTQSGFAAAIGTSQSYVNDIEHGRKTPSSETLAKLRSITEEVRLGDHNQK